MAIVLKRVSRLPFAPIVAGLFALVAAVLVMATPIWMLEGIVGRLGIDSVLAAAAPPLGAKARAVLAVLTALGTGAALWLGISAVSRLLGRKSKSAVPKSKVQVPAAPASATAMENDDLPVGRRRPILADRELGAPFMSDEALLNSPLVAAPSGPDVDTDELILNHAMIPVDTGKAPIILEAPEGHDDMDTIDPFGSANAAPPIAPAPAPEQTRYELKVPVVDDPELEAMPMDFAAARPAIPVLPPHAEGRSKESFEDLVSRLENGLARRAAAISAAQAAAEAAVAVKAVEQVSPQDAAATEGRLETAQQEVDSALRQALNTLERLAAGSR